MKARPARVFPFVASPKSLTNEFRQLRRRLGYTQKDIARVLGCSSFEIIRHEQGHLPNLKSAIKLELFYGVPLKQLFPTLYQTLARDIRSRRRRLKPALAAIGAHAPERGRRILALDPWTKAVGVALFKGEHLLDCGVRYLDGPLPDRLLQNGVDFMKEVFRLYQPQVLILPDLSTYPGRRRSSYVREFCRKLKVLARNRRVIAIDAGTVSLRLVGKPRASRHAIAVAAAHRCPELQRLLPPPRKPWQAQDLRLAAFYAVALALTANSKR